MSLGMAFGKTWEKHRATDRFAPWISFLQFFCFHDDLISFSFGGTQLPVSGVSGDNMEHNTNTGSRENPQPRAREAVLSPDLQRVGSYEQ